MTHRQAARKLNTIGKKLSRIFDELQEIRRAVPGWESVIYHNVSEKLIRAEQNAADIARRMHNHESWDDWDRAETAASNERRRIMAGTGCES